VLPVKKITIQKKDRTILRREGYHKLIEEIEKLRKENAE
jgi:hypothetical protein